MRFDPATLIAIARFAEAAYPFEGCGLVFDSGEVRAVPNLFQGTDIGRVRFEMDPAALLQALGEGTLVALFHSHCDAPAALSPEDVQGLSPDGVALYPELTHLILAVERGRATGLGVHRWDGGTWRSEFSVLAAMAPADR